MGGRGGSLRGSQGVSVSRAAVQPARRQTATTTSVTPQSLAMQIANDVGAILRMTDDQATDALKYIQNHADTGARYGTQQDTDTQRFVNWIGWGDTKPEVISEADFDARVQQENAVTYYHTDDDYGGKQGSDFNDQLMYGPNYLSGGIHGDGTYIASDAIDSRGYGSSQVKLILNKKAKVISENDLGVKIAKLYKTKPKMMEAINNLSSGYVPGGNGHNKPAVKTLVAAMLGFNVIAASGPHSFAGYHTILDKSVMTIANRKKPSYEVDQNW